MKKRILALLLCVCLMVPFMSIAGVHVSAAEAENKSFVIRNLSHYVSFSPDLVAGGVLYTTGGGKMDALDLSGKGTYRYEDVGIMMDTYVAGTKKFVKFFTSRQFAGQLEVTSGGECDVEEMGVNPASVLRFAEDEWTRVIVPLTAFTPSQGTPGEFDKSAVDFIRLYFTGGGASYAGEKGTVKLVNWRLVDLSVPEEDREELPLGDGTFQAEPPVFKKMTVGAGYDQSVSVYAGYNLKEYILSHPDVTVTNANGEKDYTAVVNSLLEGLNSAGGGALFIPAGEWEFRGNITMPPGTTIVGEWVNPDINPQIRGTILKVYGGRGEINGRAFIKMLQHTKINNVAFWYPEQTVDSFAQYPPTIETYQYTYVQNVTLVNSYFGIQNKDGANCPNAWNIYGTPLNVGVDFDMVIDIARIEELHFAANYWADSGLPGAPATGEAYNLLKDQLYNYAIGITLRRIDWSYVTYSDIKGYNIGLLFDKSNYDPAYPNGQCVGLNFIDCKYGHFSYGASSSCESLLDITMKNCEYGIYTTGTQNGVVQYYNADIQATQYAVYQDSAYTKLSVMASTIRKGRVYTKDGSNIFINNEIRTSSPHITLDYGTVAAIVIGNVDANGKPIRVSNPGACTMSLVEEPVELKPYTAMTREEAKALVKQPATTDYELPYDIDVTGETDVTEQIQTYLTKLGESGGGTLFLRPGKYRIEGVLTIPTGVELRGSADFASVPKAINTMFYVYTPIEEGKDEYTSTATVTMEEGSGIRGIIFNYPEQNSTYRITDTVVDPVKSNEETKKAQEAENLAAEAEGREPVAVTPIEVTVDYYEFDFVPYPYTIRGMGSDIYVVNVSVRNGWNGIDFKTYKCDNHYIDYLAGHFYNRGIVIGAGSENGYVRNFQFNYNSIFQCLSDVWSGWGGEPSTPDLRSAFHQPMQAQFDNNSIILQLGHVENELVYNCFNYASYIGVHLVEENGKAADARIFGHGVDYGTQSVKIEAAEHVEFTNLQLTAFNQCGDNGNTKRYAVDQSVTPLYDIWLTDTFEGEVTITNFTEWAPSPTSGVRVDSGVLNMYNAQFSHTVSHLFELNGDGKLNIVGFSSTRNDNPPLVDDDPENLHITAGFYATVPAGWEDAGTFEHVYERQYRYAVPQNVVFPEGSKIVKVESFDEYTFSDTTEFRTDDLRATTIRRGAVRLRLSANKMMLGLKAGQEKNEEKPFTLEGGAKDSIYRMEWRINVAEMRNTFDSAIYLFLSNADAKNQQVLTINLDGSVQDQTGAKFANIAIGENYRVAVEVDARNVDNKTVTVYLLDDDSNVIARGATSALNKTNFQGADKTVTGFMFSALASPIDAPETETDFTIDYFYIIKSEKSTLASDKLGDVNGDGKVDSTDARLVLQYAVGKVTTLGNMAAANVNGDSKVDSTDARLILQYAVGKIKNF